MLETLRQIPAGDVLLLHGCCHNPTGVDPTPEQWREIAEIVRERKLLPLVDFAYQGFGSGLREDAVGLETLCAPGQEMLVCSSFSKNFGLYRERVGAMTVVAEDAETADKAFSQVKAAIRANYSNPPAHGAAAATAVLNDGELRPLWENELTGMRARIHGMRNLFVETLKAQGAPRDFSFIARQRGMFSFSGLTPEQVRVLRERHSIYIVDSGRLNVAGMTEANMDRLCQAIADVLKQS
jgi:aspartate/tyrosine/aromatic aminotransferase